MVARRHRGEPLHQSRNVALLGVLGGSSLKRAGSAGFVRAIRDLIHGEKLRPSISLSDQVKYKLIHLEFRIPHRQHRRMGREAVTPAVFNGPFHATAHGLEIVAQTPQAVTKGRDLSDRALGYFDQA